MLDHNRIAYELDSIFVPDDVEGISQLVHFDYPESIAYTGGASVVQSRYKLGKGCAYYPDRDSRVTISNTTGMFNINSMGNYEIEAFVKFKDTVADLEVQGYSFYNGHTFKYFADTLTWANAKSACEALGGHLATSTSAEKNAFLDTVGGPSWLGASYNTDGSTWQWETGETWSYTNWAEGQPESESDSYHVRMDANGDWATLSNETTMRYICEWDYDMRISNIFSLGDLALNKKLTEIEKLVPETDWDAQGYKFFDGHTFKYISNAVTWANAKTACEELGGHLATSTSAEKNTFLTTLSADGFWIGGTNEGTEGTWRWSNGEEWNYTNWGTGEPNSPNDTQYLCMNQAYYTQYYNQTGVWNDAPASMTMGFVCEWDCDMREVTTYTGYGNPYLQLTSSSLDIEGTSQTALDCDTWYHILLRISNETASVYVNGTEMINTTIPAQAVIEPEQVTLGGYIGYMDEFAFRRNASTSAPEIPEHPYDSVIIQEGGSSQTERESTAPVTRAAWSAENLPEGLSLSENGILTGHPTTAGTYDVPFSVSTNWGTATKTLRIVVQ